MILLKQLKEKIKLMEDMKLINSESHCFINDCEHISFSKNGSCFDAIAKINLSNGKTTGEGK